MTKENQSNDPEMMNSNSKLNSSLQMSDIDAKVNDLDNHFPEIND